MINRIVRLPHKTAREEAETFSVVSRVEIVGSKAARYILIFDNHPATLRLLGSSFLSKPDETKLGHKVFAVALILATGTGIIWTLFQ